MTKQLSSHHPYQFRYRRVDRCQWIKASDAVHSFIREVKGKDTIMPEGVELHKFRVRTNFEADWVLSNLNKPQSRYNSLLSYQSHNQNWQCFDYIRSNLGKGFLFFFICGRCFCRASILYMPDGQYIYSCRDCHKLSYPTTKQKVSDAIRYEKLFGTASN